MKFRAILFLLFGFCFFQSQIVLGEISTDAEGNVTLEDGSIIYSDSELIIESDEASFDSNVFCDIGVLASSGGVFQDLRSAGNFCNGFDRFCHSRQFGNNFFEGRFRQRQIFRGRGRDHFGARGAAWGLYLDFLNGRGRGGFGARFQQKFGHQFFFSNNCTGRG